MTKEERENYRLLLDVLNGASPMVYDRKWYPCGVCGQVDHDEDCPVLACEKKGLV